MNIHEFTRPVTVKTLNENLAKMYGQKLNLSKFTFEQLEDFRNKVRTKISQVQTRESFDKVLKDAYQKDKLFLDILNAEIQERISTGRAISEGAEDNAEIVMAAKDMVDRVTGWMEDTAEMQTESMLDLADAIRDEMGSEKAEAFTASIKPALEAMYGVMETTRQTLTQGVGMLTGEAAPTDMMGGDDDMSMEPTVDGDMDMDMDTDTGDLEGDDFDADMAATGGDLETGREKRESVQRSKKKLR